VNAIWQYFRNDQDEILHWTWTTVWLAGGALIVGFVIALPLGWLASRFRWTYPPLVTLAGIVYTIPSVVLFLALPGLIGTKILAPINVGIALTAYTVALMVRIVADGLSSVSTDTLASASAMGYTGRQRLLGVQFPIAIPVIGAGLRVAAVSNVSLVSVASIIGVSQLGQLFVAGNNNNTLTPIWLGLIIIMALAFVFDGLILLAVRLLTPWQRAVSNR
jgi:osmoprotectant transport system permease protein